MGSVFVRPITRGFGGHGLSLVSGWIRLPPWQRSTSRCAAGSADGRPVTRCTDVFDSWKFPGRVPAESLGGSLGGQNCSWTAAGKEWSQVTGPFQGWSFLDPSPWTQMGVSLPKSLCGQAFSWTTAGRSWSWITGTLHNLQLHLYWEACLWGHRWVFLLLDPWADKTAIEAWLGGAGTEMQGCFNIHS